jgi:hypothetical protein
VPKPPGILHLEMPCEREDAIASLREACAGSEPLTGACWHRDVIYLRFESGPEALAALRRRHAHMQESQQAFWEKLREWELPEFPEGTQAWMLDLAPATALAESDSNTCTLVDWGGARRYLPGAASMADAVADAERGQGSVQRLGGGEADIEALPEPPPALRSLLERVKAAVDAAGTFNPQRLYSWF